MALTNFPNGVASFGVPLPAGNLPVTSGKYIFVSSTTGSNGNNGSSVTSPKATIAGALTEATASKGDVIVVMPGHAESVASAAGIALSKAGVSIVGMGRGGIRPTLTFTTATTATMTISAANVSIDNFNYTSTFDAVVSPIVVSAAGVALTNSSFETATASAQVTQMILTTAGANDFLVANNRFFGTGDAGNTCAITLVGGNNFQAIDNSFIGAYTTSVGAIQSITTLNTNCLITGNNIVNKTASATKGVSLLTGSTGQVTKNIFGIGSGAAPITGDAVHWGGNWSAAAVATNGTLV